MANTKIKNTVLDSSVISGQTTVTAATNDFVMIQDVSDSNNLKKALISDFGGSTSFVIEDDDGTEVTIDNDKEVKFIGSGITTNWTDTSNGSDGDPYDLTFSIDAAQTNITSIFATDLKIGEDDQTKIDFETADEIHFYAANAEQVFVSDGVFGPQTDSDVDLGTSSVRFKDAYFDTLNTSGAITSSGTLSVGISSSAGGVATFFGTGTGAEAKVQIEGEGGADPFINFLVNNTTHWAVGVRDSDSDKFMIANNSDLSSGVALVIDSSENVGIGTTSPTQKLDVNGTVELNNLTVGGTQGSDGQVLTSTGSGIAWEDAASGGGGVTGITSNADATALTLTSDENLEIESGNIRYKEDKFIYSFKGGTSGQVRSGILFDGTNQSVDFYTAQNERMSIDSSGTLTTPSGTDMNIMSASGMTLGSTTSIAVFKTNNSERMRIGTTGQLDITPNSGVTAINLKDGGTSGTNYGFIGGGNALKSGGSANDFSFRTDTGSIDFYTNGQNLRFALESDGQIFMTDNVTMGTATQQDNAVISAQKSGSNSDPVLDLDHDTGDASFYRFIKFRKKNESSAIGRLDADVTGSSMTLAFDSDGRYKDILGDADGLNLISKLEPIKFKWKDGTGEGSQGFIAQDFKKAFDDVGSYARGVYEPKDESKEKWQLDYGTLVPNLVKAIQEQQEQIEVLQNEIQQLKGEE